jgi:predicted PurR-regulated permease PerM
VLGHQLTLNPLVVLLALAFWAWIWGPLGAFLAVPVTIIGLVTLHHLFPPRRNQIAGVKAAAVYAPELFRLPPVTRAAKLP